MSIDTDFEGSEIPKTHWRYRRVEGGIIGQFYKDGIWSDAPGLHDTTRDALKAARHALKPLKHREYRRGEYRNSEAYKQHRVSAQKRYMEKNKDRWSEYYRGKYHAKRQEREREQHIPNMVMRLFNENIAKITLARRDATRDVDHRRSMRERAIRHLGGRCSWCGLDNFLCLELDHVEPVRRRTNGIKRHDSLKFCREILSGEETNAQVLCSNCHTIKTRLNSEYGIDTPADFDPLETFSHSGD